MGCAGRILQKRLWHKLDNVFLFDFGSLIDAICGWKTRAWIKLTHFDSEAFIKKLSQDVKIVYIAALIDKKYEMRKKEYIHSLTILKGFGYEPYIVEACKTASFFDDYDKNVCYSNVNDLRLRNQGVNEARSLIEGFNQFDFNDDDMIIKLTGRYYFENDSFIRLVENYLDVDAFIKTDRYGQVHTGCFALRYKYFKEMLTQLDFEKMEKHMINLEAETAHYIKELQNKNLINVMNIDKLNLTCNVFGRGNNTKIYHL